ncbi:hypothetical protein GW17_00011605 [Ensete ventricosum]|nr:hypothetical protein GW17_00011605 [Ensete ventricosum]
MGRVLGGMESDLLLCYFFSFLLYSVAQCVMAMKEHDIPPTIITFYPTVVRGYSGVGPFQRLITVRVSERVPGERCAR